MQNGQAAEKSWTWVHAWLGFWVMALLGEVYAEGYPIEIARLAATPAGESIMRSPLSESADWQATTSRQVRITDGSWLRLGIPPISSSQPLYLITPRRGTGQLVLMLPSAEQAIVSDHYRGPFRADLSSRYHVFEIPQHLPTGLTALLQARGQTSTVQPELLARDALFTRDHQQFAFDVFLRTVLLVMALVNLMVWIMLRERVYAAYVAYVLVLLAAFGAHDASLYSLPLLRWWGNLEYSGIWILANLSAILLISFARDFVPARPPVIWLDRILHGVQLTFIASAILALLRIEALWLPLTYAMGAGYTLTATLLLIPAIIAARAGRHYGWIFIVGFTPHALTMIVQAAGLLGIIGNPDWLYTAFLAAIAFEAIVFALGLAYRALLYRRERDAALELADQDGLTHVFNRRALDRKLDDLCAMVADDELSGIALLFIDLDHFKRVNDAYGHAVGDECLRQIAGLIQSELRQGDLLGRYGGEEFVVVLPGNDREDALGIAERIRKRASSTTLSIGGHQVRVHLSIGVASTSGRMADPARLLKRADKAMYRSKSEGRNRVTLITPND
jgi:diguanylate cyclase (GGDEF)-like protein